MYYAIIFLIIIFTITILYFTNNTNNTIELKPRKFRFLETDIERYIPPFFNYPELYWNNPSRLTFEYYPNYYYFPF